MLNEKRKMLFTKKYLKTKFLIYYKIVKYSIHVPLQSVRPKMLCLKRFLNTDNFAVFFIPLYSVIYSH